MVQYILCVSCAAVFSALIRQLQHGKTAAVTVTKIVCALFLLFAVLSPLRQISVPDLSQIMEDCRIDAAFAAEEGETITQNALRESIKERTQAYILDKAEDLQLQLQVEVTLSEDEIPMPVAVVISGSVSPYAKSLLQSMLQEDLGISKENQLWT